MNPDGSGLQQITTNSVDTYGPVPSHDGTRIAYYMQHGNGYDVRVMNADGSNDTLVRTFAQSNGWVGVDTWLPNDSQLVLNSFYYNTGIGQAFTLSLDGSTQSVFIDSAITGMTGSYYGPMHFSSDGQRVTWAQCYSGRAPADVFVANYTNGAVDYRSIRQLESNGFYNASPCFSPDGSLIVDNEGSSEGLDAFFVYGPTGNTNIAQLSPGSVYLFDWTPGNKILFYGYPTTEAYANIYTVNADGSALTNVTSGQYYDSDPRWRVVPTTTYINVQNQPVSQLLIAGSAVTFSIQASGYPTQLYYQWQLNGTNISGATSSSLTISNVVQTNLGVYTVVVTNTSASVTSSNATLSMYPYIDIPFTGAITYWGETNTFSVGAWGTGPLSYQWFQNGVALPTATNQTMTLTNIQTTNAGLYSVVVSSALGSVTNAPQQVVVESAGVSLGFSPSITITGVVNYHYIIQSTTNLANTNAWVTLTNLTLTQPVQTYADTSVVASSPFYSKYYYRILPGQ